MSERTWFAIEWCCLAFGMMGLAGCGTLGQSRVTTHFEETVTEEGSSTIFKAESSGEVEESLHQMNYRWGGAENQIVVGQDASGVTSPAQQAFVAGLAGLIANVPGMWSALMQAVTPVPGPPDTAPTMPPLDPAQISALLEALQK